MTAPNAIGAAMRVRDVLELTSDNIVLVADHGQLVGSVRRSRLWGVEPHLPVGEVADAPVGLDAEEPLDQVRLVIEEHGGGPVGVVDRRGRLIGAIAYEQLDVLNHHTQEMAS